MENRKCPCCRDFVFEEIGKYEICPVCGWEDDPIQRKDPEFKGGANTLCLREYRDKYMEDSSDEAD